MDEGKWSIRLGGGGNEYLLVAHRGATLVSEPLESGLSRRLGGGGNEYCFRLQAKSGPESAFVKCREGG